MSTYVIGDLHGQYRSLKQCLVKCNFDYREDTLIQLGDIVFMDLF
ncbi:metallophosphoesterase [Niastella yeongjuensis]|nr:metallophosphoesterase [Niastella yeongjuensis]SEP00415.1 Calcineurin-like phosphoesterase [Niastella yeongjuensis]